MKQLDVSGIKNGTVIDHLPPDKVFIITKLLDLENKSDMLLMGTNLRSKRLAKKGIIKIAGHELTQTETDRLALIAPSATVNIIENYDVTEKRTIRLPDNLVDVAPCPNPMCITNHNPILTRFVVLEKELPIRLRCHYCERVFNGAELL